MKKLEMINNVKCGGHRKTFQQTASNIYALGLTYVDHLKEVGEKKGNPIVFKKNCSPTVSLQSHLNLPSSHQLLDEIRNLDSSLALALKTNFDTFPCLLDYEVEIGLVILERITCEMLDNKYFNPTLGFILVNDITARSVQIAGEASSNKYDFWSASKSFPGFLPCADTVWIPDSGCLDQIPEFILETFVNGELRQSASTTNLLYTPREILQIVMLKTQNGILDKNDLILTGTPAGIGLRVPLWKRRLASLLPKKIRVNLAIKSNRRNPKLLGIGDEVIVKGGVLGEIKTKIVCPRFVQSSDL
jgi:2-keto-4-pentenoate hydratase/2-oxohepta-3-ene-1,7-dioic acid hydratase in catechol pathway